MNKRISQWIAQVFVFSMIGLGILAYYLSGSISIWFNIEPPGGRTTFTLLLFVILMFMSFRATLHWFAVPVGRPLIGGTTDEWRYGIYCLYYLFFLAPFLRIAPFPVSMSGIIYRLVGAKLGKYTYSAGLIFDAHLVTFGNDCLIGDQALLTPHLIDGNRVLFAPIQAGNDVTIGARAIILGGVKIGDGAVIAAGAVVPSNTVIGDYEVWGGNPARRLKMRPMQSSIIGSRDHDKEML